MDRAEAIKVLEQEQSYLMGGASPNINEYEDAIKMAIAALREQEELEKLCSERGALLDEICGMCNLCKHYCGGNGDEYCRECALDSQFEWRGLPEV